MHLDVPYKLIELTPDQDLIDFDWAQVSQEEWGEHTKLKEGYKVFGEIFNLPIFGVPFQVWANPSPTAEVRLFFTENPVHALLMNEVRKIEQLYNAKALVGVLDGMPPGTNIPTHSDVNPIFKACHRVHLPLVTDPGVKFYIDGIEHHFTAGEFFEFDNSRPHAVKNQSDIFRIHLVVDLIPLSN